MNDGKVALVGATGAIGKSVAAVLRKQGRPYRVIGRSRDSLQKMFGGDPLAESAAWDPDKQESIREAIRGVTAAVYMVGVPYTDFHLHPVLMRRFLEAAIAENLDRMLLIGTLYVFGRPQASRINDTDPLVVDDSALQQLLGGIDKTPYVEGVRQSFAAAR